MAAASQRQGQSWAGEQNVVCAAQKAWGSCPGIYAAALLFTQQQQQQQQHQQRLAALLPTLGHSTADQMPTVVPLALDRTIWP